VENAPRDQIEVLESDKKKLESALFDEREYHEKYLQGTEKVEAAHYSVNKGLQNRLQERNRRIRQLEATLHWQREALFLVHTEACLERESANRRIKELEIKVRVADHYREKVSPPCYWCPLVRKQQADTRGPGCSADCRPHQSLDCELRLKVS